MDDNGIRVNALCRLCVNPVSLEDSIGIFNSNEKSTNLAECIECYCSVTVSEDDGLPRYICCKCNDRLNDFISFKNQCVWAYSTLKAALNDYQGLLTKSSQHFLAENADNKQQDGEHIDDNSAILNLNKNETANLKTLSITKKLSSSSVKKKLKSTNKSKKAQESFACKFCKKKYPSEGGWRYHMYTIHNSNFQPKICDLCGKAFKVKKNLESHKNTIHYRIKQHMCHLCGQRFTTKYGLKVHTLWHTGERNFSCEICGTSFRTRSKLNEHKAVHRSAMRFICEVCSRGFRWKKDFAIHLRTHTGEKPYTCSKCSRAFVSATNLRKHELTSHQIQ